MQMISPSYVLLYTVYTNSGIRQGAHNYIDHQNLTLHDSYKSLAFSAETNHSQIFLMLHEEEQG